MSAKLRKLAMMLAITVILFDLTLLNMKVVYSNSTGGKIDLFTQNEPYNGKGPNMPSDAFGPEDLVILYALVTYNGIPVQNILVTFSVHTPNNVLFSLTSRTDSDGIAVVNFTILTPPIDINENEVFGTWSAFANVLFNSNIFQDSLTFRVDWIVKLISVRTIDENLTHRATFGKKGDVGVEIALRSVVMTVKTATIAIAIHDELNVPVSFLEIRDFKVQPNEKLVLLYCKLQIPTWAYVGNATIFVSALTAPVNESGVSYCPGLSTEFFISPYNPLEISFHDLAIVNVYPSVKSVEVGECVNIDVILQNEGTQNESFAVSAYCGVVLIGTLEVTALAPYSQLALNFTLDTSLFDLGNYTITASIPYLLNEADLSDNFFDDGIVEIKLPVVIHDIAVTNVSISNNSLYIGESLQINVSVINKGSETETFNVETYYDSSLIGNLNVDTLAPNAQAKLIFVWDTSLVQTGFYQIRASAPLINDVDVSDNTFVDGIVQVKARPSLPPAMIHDVAILSVSPSTTSVYIGDVVEIDVVVKNQGDFSESFNVQAYYNGTLIEAKPIVNLSASSNVSIRFIWNTSELEEGSYLISALVSAVPGEENLENNLYVNGSVQVAKTPKGWFVPDWFYWLLLPLLILVIVLLAIWLYRRRRKKAEETFYSGWTAWYYCYDLRSRVRKSRQ